MTTCHISTRYKYIAESHPNSTSHNLTPFITLQTTILGLTYQQPYKMAPKIVLLSIVAMLGVAVAAPVQSTIARLPRTEAPSKNLANILPGSITKLVSEILDKLPVDASVNVPVLQKKRDPAVDVDLGGLGLSLKPREADPAVNVDLGALGLSLKPREADPAVNVDLGALGLSLK
jgi:hypothetical protein